MTSGDLHTAHATLFVRALASAGVRHAVVSPGSRSTPLALAFAREPAIETHVVIDERSAAFVALGQARVTGNPSVVVATSGSAGAHYYPAILEAERARIPLIAITADRPWELTDASAPQTLDQTKLYGSHVRATFELGSPEVAALAHLPRIAAHAVEMAVFRAGPVHVNARFRKPLEPIAGGGEPWRSEYEALIERGAPRVFRPELTPSRAAIEHLASLARRASRGVLIAGPAWDHRVDSLAEAVREFVERSGFGLFAEATSGLMFHPCTATGVSSPELAARAGILGGVLGPDLAIEIGHPPTSGAYAELATARRFRRVVIAPDGIPDPLGTATSVVIGDATSVLSALAKELPTRCRAPRGSSSPMTGDALTEPRIARMTSELVPPSSVLVCGNSLIVRDFDAFARPVATSLSVLHQRGLAGIDGLIAGAVGVRSVVPRARAVIALIGDVAALHDVGSLRVVADVEGALVIVVVENGGGRIFGELPIANVSDAKRDFERLFITPPGRAFPDVARAFGIACVEVGEPHELAAALQSACAASLPMVVVAHVDPELSAQHRRSLFELARRQHDSASPMENRHDYA